MQTCLVTIGWRVISVGLVDGVEGVVLLKSQLLWPMLDNWMRLCIIKADLGLLNNLSLASIGTPERLGRRQRNIISWTIVRAIVQVFNIPWTIAMPR
jgi:hypothetical protein